MGILAQAIIAYFNTPVCPTMFTKKNRKAILEHVFKEGVIVVLNDPRAAKHNELTEIPNLHVMMVMKSLASRAYVTEKFNWMWHYYFLTNEGIEYLRDVLHLPATVFPLTLTKQRPTRPALADVPAGDSKGGGKGGWGKGKGYGKGGWDRED